ncbi:MAG: peptide chain release factor-like protein [Acidobacteria bacterium]|nr:peptide chain release factor-like protein [Acidobacteriota bacterium]
MSKFGVRVEKEVALQARMLDLHIREEDLEEKFIRSSGPGGQNVNKTATCVYLKHRPTGIEVKVQQDRSQALNRFLARRILADRIEESLSGAGSAQERERERIKRQKQRRGRRTKKKLSTDAGAPGENNDGLSGKSSTPSRRNAVRPKQP